MTEFRGFPWRNEATDPPFDVTMNPKDQTIAILYPSRREEVWSDPFV